MNSEEDRGEPGSRGSRSHREMPSKVPARVELPRSIIRAHTGEARSLNTGRAACGRQVCDSRSAGLAESFGLESGRGFADNMDGAHFKREFNKTTVYKIKN